MPKLLDLTTIRALKRKASEMADEMNAMWQELDALEARIEEQEMERETAA